MVDRDRVLAKVDELRAALTELRAIVPADLESYRTSVVRRACERMLQVCVEIVIDTSALLVAGKGLGLPADEDDVLQRLEDAGSISGATADLVRRMKGMRNIIVHGYGKIDDRLVFDVLRTRIGDFERFIDDVLGALDA